MAAPGLAWPGLAGLGFNAFDATLTGQTGERRARGWNTELVSRVETQLSSQHQLIEVSRFLLFFFLLTEMRINMLMFTD